MLPSYRMPCRGQVVPVDQHAVLRAPRVLGHEVRGPRREAPALREAVVDAAGHRHVEDLDSQIRRVALGDPCGASRPAPSPPRAPRGRRRFRWCTASRHVATARPSSSRTRTRGRRSRTRSRASFKSPTASGRRWSQSGPRRRAASAASEARAPSSIGRYPSHLASKSTSPYFPN